MSIKKIRFLWYNLFDLGTLTALNEAAGFPVTNIQLRWHTRCWRSSGAINEWAKNDLLTEQDIKALVVEHHNFLTGANVHIQATNVMDTWTFLDEALTIETGKPIVKFWETAESYRWWRLFMANANPAGYDEIGRAFLGSFYQPTYDITRPAHHTPIDPSVRLYSSGGQASVDERTHYEKIIFEWDMIPAADKAIFESIFARVGISKPYFICRTPDDAVNTTYYVQNLVDFDFIPLFHGWYELIITVETMR